ncbi:serine hydrolase [Numidum massiliense]|uniref:serine hydrolase n=1 Tax=Numidum massiliense TaxID=1522315 RepID=UPI000AF6EC85|nr:serine hydrolase [Numidum massiliense]
MKKYVAVVLVAALCVLPFSFSGGIVDAKGQPTIAGQLEILLDKHEVSKEGRFFAHEGRGTLILEATGKKVKHNIDIFINGRRVDISPHTKGKPKSHIEIDVGAYLLDGLNDIIVKRTNNGAKVPKVIVPYPELIDGTPEQVGMNSSKLAAIDRIVEEAIEEGITPGAVVLVAKDNKVVKEKAYGLAYKYDMGQLLDNPRAMTTSTIFDLASVTKVMGTTQGIMKLVAEGKIRIEDSVAKYMPDFAANGKEHITIADLLTHTSGLTPWKPTYFYAENEREVRRYINELPLEYPSGTKRAYSDFSFMVLGFIIEEVSGEPLDAYLEKNIYAPLKMQDTMFNPSDRLKQRIAATSWGNPYEYKMVDDPNFGYYVEEDADDFCCWRDYTLIGEVNDGNSYYANEGVAGHAGLFSTARDLAVLGQAMLNGGGYGTNKLYDSETVATFTAEQRFGHGFGWERNGSYMGSQHSGEAFGHTGFTGTQVIFDPVHRLQIVVLTNKQNNGPRESGSYYSTFALTRNIADTVYESFAQTNK